MRLRPRTDAESCSAAARVLGLLVPPPAGWVPPAEPRPAAVPGPAAAAPGLPAPGEAAGAPGGAGTAVRPPDRGATDGPVDADLAPPSSDSHGQRGSEDGRRQALVRIPAALRHGRVDPGRRGAVALVVAALLAAVVAGGVVLRARPQEVVVPDVVASGAPLPGATPSAAPATEVVVAVAGKVVRPGLVRLPAGSRVDDAVRAAGGVLPGADAGLLNLARPLVDGEQVLVGVDPPPGAPPGAPPAAGTAGPAVGLLDLNAATVADLDALPGIGPVLAQRIVDWRTEHGRFASVEQLREVTGIGESKYADLEAKVTV